MTKFQYQKILNLEKKFKFLDHKNSPSKIVGFKPSKTFKKMNHKVTIIGEILPKKGRNHLFSAKKVFKLSKYKGYSHIF